MTETETETSESPPPTFDCLPLSAEVRRAVDELGYTHPTPVQREVFEPASRGKDIVVQARTGTGKTAAFGLPLVDSLVRRNTKSIQAMVLCPTRELALQVSREIEMLGKHKGVTAVAIYGGAAFGPQVDAIEAGAQIVAGTPGRVLDHLRRKTLNPETIKTLVLDESDEMLSMGFLPQIQAIEAALPDTKQTMLFSATLPPDILRHAETRLNDPEFVTLSGDQVGALSIQHFVYVTLGDKVSEFIRILEVENPESAIVFCNTKEATKRVAAALQAQGYDADWLNADLSQADRERVMSRTRKGELRFLVCTDVAARGIDISHLTHVINYDFPESAEAYVHRTGRTGRAGKTGTAIALITPSAMGALYTMRLTFKIRPIEKTLPSQRELKTRAEADLVDMFVQMASSQKTHRDDLALARRLLSHGQAEEVVATLMRDHLGARPDAVEEATAARRAKAPTPAPEPAEARPARPQRDRAPRSVRRPSDDRSDRPDDTRSERSAARAPRAARDEADSEARPSRDARQPREAREPREERPRREPRAPRTPREDRTPRNANDAAQDAHDGRESRTTRDASDSGEANTDDAPRRRRRRRTERRPDEDDARGARFDETFDLPKVTISDAPPPSERPSANEAAGGDARASNRNPRRPAAAPRDRGGERDGSARRRDRSVREEEIDADLAEVFVNVGRKDGVTAADLRSTLAERAGLSDDDVRYVRVKFKHSFIGVPKERCNASLEAFNGVTLGDREVLAEPARRPSVLPSAAPQAGESADAPKNDATSEATPTG